MSVRAFQKEMEARRVPGSSYPNVHRYLAGRSEPTLEFLREAAGVLGVRVAWLATNAGEPTEAAQGRVEATAAVTDIADHVRARVSQEVMEGAWGVSVERLNATPSWAAPLAELWMEEGGRDHLIARSLGPAFEAFGLNFEELEFHAERDLMFSAIPFLWALRREGARQERLRNSYCEGMDEGEQAAYDKETSDALQRSREVRAQYLKKFTPPNPQPEED